MKTDGRIGDPSLVDLQWFADGEGNPGQASGEGAGDAGRTLVTELAQAQPGSGSEPASQAGAQGGQTAGGKETAGAGTEQQLAGFAAAATKELKADPKFIAWASKFKTFDDAARASIELEAKMGTADATPTDKSSPEEIAAYRKRHDIPPTPDEYKLDRITGLPYDDIQENELRKFFHDNHVPQAVAAAFYKQMGERMVKEIAAFTARKDEIKAATLSQLKKEQGQNYDGFLTTFNQGLAKYASPELRAKLEKSGLGNDYDIVMHFAKLGSLVKEDTAVQRGGAPTGRLSDAQVLFGNSSK